MEISVVIPCLNEELSIRKCIEKSFNSFQTLGIEGEVIVVDNNCTDNTAHIARSCGARVVECKPAGYGYALQEGFKNAKGRFIIMGDGDDSYDFNEIPKFYEKITSTDCAMVTGTRIKGDIKKGAMPFLHQYLGTPVLTMILNLLYRVGISDVNCGMRMFNSEYLDKLTFTAGGMEFASELFVLFAKNKFKIVEIPIALYPVTNGRVPKLNAFRDGFRHLFYLISNFVR
ncbi:MAG: glycosyltransferase family 2 protein [Elusimicrobia bacterium]|nr:glycosyltransferase family 2 protein [Elusimicrobiota bacterium]